MSTKPSELTRSAMESILSEEEEGCLCLARDQEPYAVPVSYAFLDGHVVIDCARSGRKLDVLRSNPKACFVVSRRHDRLQPHDGKCSFPYESVLCFGSAREVVDPTERQNWLTRFKEHFYLRLGLAVTPVTEADVARTSCVVLSPESMTGRRQEGG